MIYALYNCNKTEITMYLGNIQRADMSFLESYSIFSVTTAHSECHMSYNIKQAIIIF